jgi:hypothetical protein
MVTQCGVGGRRLLRLFDLKNERANRYQYALLHCSRPSLLFFALTA